MKVIRINPDLSLIPFYSAPEQALTWYQDLKLCKQVDNIDYPYSLERLEAMYNYLTSHGECYYIKFQDQLIGDISLYDENEIAIVICKEFQNKHLGRKCVSAIMTRAQEKGLSSVKAQIYDFNKQSQAMFHALGFHKTAKEEFSFDF